MFSPVNRYVHIQANEDTQPETESGILLPESFDPNDDEHAIVTVISASDDVTVTKPLAPGTQIVVVKSMIEKINLLGKNTNVILENYIVGILQ